MSKDFFPSLLCHIHKLSQFLSLSLSHTFFSAFSTLFPRFLHLPNCKQIFYLVSKKSHSLKITSNIHLFFRLILFFCPRLSKFLLLFLLSLSLCMCVCVCVVIANAVAVVVVVVLLICCPTTISVDRRVDSGHKRYKVYSVAAY